MINDSKSFTLDEFVRECQASGFLGAYKFWETLLQFEEVPDGLRRHAYLLLAKIGQMVKDDIARNMRAYTPQEKEAFEWIEKGL